MEVISIFFSLPPGGARGVEVISPLCHGDTGAAFESPGHIYCNESWRGRGGRGKRRENEERVPSRGKRAKAKGEDRRANERSHKLSLSGTRDEAFPTDRIGCNLRQGNPADS